MTSAAEDTLLKHSNKVLYTIYLSHFPRPNYHVQLKYRIYYLGATFLTLKKYPYESGKSVCMWVR